MHLLARRALLIAPTLLALLPYLVFAQGQRASLPDRIVPCNGVDCSCQDLVTLAQNILNGGIFIAVFLCAMLFAYAGWLYLSNEAIGEQNRAKSIFSNVALGLFIILAAWMVVSTLVEQIARPGFVWNDICSALKL